MSISKIRILEIVKTAAVPYAGAIFRLRWVHSRYRNCALGTVVDRMAKLGGPLAKAGLLPASLARSVDTAVRSFPVISNVVVFRELYEQSESLHTLLDKFVYVYKLFYCQ